MEPKLDLLYVSVSAEIIRLREVGALDSLDCKSQNILFVVAEGQSKGNNVAATDIVAALKATSSYSSTINRVRKLTADGWLTVAVDPDFNRSLVYQLTPRAIQFVNTLSQLVRNQFGLHHSRSVEA